jgi:hypothetical protein
MKSECIRKLHHQKVEGKLITQQGEDHHSFVELYQDKLKGAVVVIKLLGLTLLELIMCLELEAKNLKIPIPRYTLLRLL